MSNIARMMQQATAGAAGAGLDVDEVFSTFLYTGNGTAGRTITNNIDISTEGGLIWTKSRDSTYNHTLGDTANGVNKYLYSNTMADIDTSVAYYTAFNNNGYVIGDASQSANASELNTNGVNYVSWCFRKAEGFFDLMTWTGNSAADRAISHNLGSVPGMIIVKRTVGGNENWAVWHKDVHANTSKVMYLDQQGGLVTSNAVFGQTNPTSTHFYVGDHPLSNNNGDSYVAYVFGHNNGDGTFGPSADQDIIECGSYYGNGSSSNFANTLGWEPQFLMIKKASAGSTDWRVFDTVRGWGVGDRDFMLSWNSTSAETGSQNWVDLRAKGFKLTNANGNVNGNGDQYIYMAIRRGPLEIPESSGSVFNQGALQNNTNRTLPTDLTNGQNADMVLWKNTAGGQNWFFQTRKHGRNFTLIPNLGNATSGSYGDAFNKENSNVCGDGSIAVANSYGWMWSEAPNFLDIQTYTGTGAATQEIEHNLGITPEMIWVKDTGNSSNWSIYHSALGLSKILNFATNAAGTGNQYWGTAAHTSTSFRVGSDSDTGGSSKNYIAWLFGTVNGVSKVGSFTFANSSGALNVDCGFSNGAKLVIFKRTNNTGDWYVVDSVRGINSGNDPYLRINADFAQNSSTELINPLSSGFTVQHNQGVVDGDYIFYAIAA